MHTFLPLSSGPVLSYYRTKSDKKPSAVRHKEEDSNKFMHVQQKVREGGVGAVVALVLNFTAVNASEGVTEGRWTGNQGPVGVLPSPGRHLPCLCWSAVSVYGL